MKIPFHFSKKLLNTSSGIRKKFVDLDNLRKLGKGLCGHGQTRRSKVNLSGVYF